MVAPKAGFDDRAVIHVEVGGSGPPTAALFRHWAPPAIKWTLTVGPCLPTSRLSKPALRSYRGAKILAGEYRFGEKFRVKNFRKTYFRGLKDFCQKKLPTFDQFFL